MGDDHLYGNVPLPCDTNSKDATRTGASHGYVNTPTLTSDPIYGNVDMPSNTKDTDGTQVSLASIIGDDGVKDDSESFYDVLPPPCQVSKKIEFDPGDYVNIAPPLEGAVGGIDVPPDLPPKKNKGNRRSINEVMGITPQLEETAKRPVPKPRTTVAKGRANLGSSDLSPGNSTADLKKDCGPPVLKPIPKPRPKPRGIKSQSGQDSASPCSSTSDSPRHSVNTSPVSLPSPALRDLSPDMPREQAPTPPKAQPNEEENNPVTPLSVENVPSPEVPIQKVPNPAGLSQPPYELQLSMETEVPPAQDLFPCISTQTKIPIPESCIKNNNEKVGDGMIGEVTSWSENEVYESTRNPKGYTDPDHPQKLDDFIKSLTQDKKDNTAQSDVPQSEKEPETEDFYQVICSTVIYR